MNELLEEIIDVAPLFQELMQEEVAIGVSDKEKYLALFDTEHLKFPPGIKPGTSLKEAGYWEVEQQVEKTGEAFVVDLPPEVTGTIPIRGYVTPVFEDGVMVGLFFTNFSRERETILENLAINLTEAVQTVSTSLNETIKTIEELDHLMNSLAEDFEEMKEIVRNSNESIALIKGIAKQTNLLSLNASIEASRAGNAGNGFAIVAQEMQKLSEQSKKIAENVEASLLAIEATMFKTNKQVEGAREINNKQIMRKNEVSASVRELVEHSSTLLEQTSKK